MSTMLKGMPPEVDLEGEQYLLKKLDEVRKDCQWLLGLGAAGILGAVLKNGFGNASPSLRLLTALISGLQVMLSMLGAMAWLTTDVDKTAIHKMLTRRLRTRNRLRNLSIVLLGLSFLLFASMAWKGGLPVEIKSCCGN
jgi:hypothetical protein